MLAKSISFRLGLVVVLAGILACSGCSYVKSRATDFGDVFDIGVTVSNQPTFGLYIGFLDIISVGYSDFDGKLFGMANRHYGEINARQHATGFLFSGREQFGYEDFKADDPNSPTPWGAAIAGRGSRPPKPQIVNCPKIIHLGWIGLTINCKFGELADFIVGLTTLDIMNDDTADKPQ